MPPSHGRPALALAVLLLLAAAPPATDLLGDPLPTGPSPAGAPSACARGTPSAPSPSRPTARRSPPAAYDNESTSGTADSGASAAASSGTSARSCALAFSPDGKHVASGGDDRTVRVWDVDERQGAAPPRRAHAGRPGRRLRAGRQDAGLGRQRLRRCASGTWKRARRRHKLRRARQRRQRRRLLPGRQDAGLGRRRRHRSPLGRGQRQAAPQADRATTTWCWRSPSRPTARSSPRGARTRRCGCGTRPPAPSCARSKVHDDAVAAVAFCGRRQGADHGGPGRQGGPLGRGAPARNWGASTATTPASPPRTLSADGAGSAVGNESGTHRPVGRDSPARRWCRSSGPGGPVQAVAFTPDGKALALPDGAGSVLFLDPASGKEQRRFRAYAATRPRHSPPTATYWRSTRIRDGERLSLWDAAAGKHLRDLPGRKPPSPATGSASRRRSPRTASSSSARPRAEKLRVWDAATGKEVRSLAVEIEGQRRSASPPAPDGRARGGRLRGRERPPLGRGVGAAAAPVERRRGGPPAVWPSRPTAAPWRAAASVKGLRLWEVLTEQTAAAIKDPVAAYQRHRLQPRRPDRRRRRRSLVRLSGTWRPAGKSSASRGHQGRSFAWLRPGRQAAGLGERGRHRPGVGHVPAPAGAGGRDAAAKELEARWADLGGDDAVRAYAAMWALAAVPKQSVPLVPSTSTPSRAWTRNGWPDCSPSWTTTPSTCREKATAELKRAAESIEERGAQGTGTHASRRRCGSGWGRCWTRARQAPRRRRAAAPCRRGHCWCWSTPARRRHARPWRSWPGGAGGVADDGRPGGAARSRGGRRTTHDASRPAPPVGHKGTVDRPSPHAHHGASAALTGRSRARIIGQSSSVSTLVVRPSEPRP